MQDFHLIELPRIQDPRGNLTFVQNQDLIPFNIARVFWTYDVPGGEVRGGHAYYKQHEIIIALSGSFEVIIRSKQKAIKVQLNRPYNALYLPPLTWRHMENFSTNALSLHLSSTKYQAEDYIRDIELYKSLINKN